MTLRLVLAHSAINPVDNTHNLQYGTAPPPPPHPRAPPPPRLSRPPLISNPEAVDDDLIDIIAGPSYDDNALDVFVSVITG